MDRQDRDIDSGWVRIRPQGGGRPPRVDYIPPGELGSYLAGERRAAPRPLWPAWLHAGRIVALAIVATGAAIVCSGCEPEQLSCAAEEPEPVPPGVLDPATLCLRPGDVVATALGQEWRVHICSQDSAPAMDLRADVVTDLDPPAPAALELRNSVQCDDGTVGHAGILVALDSAIPQSAVLYNPCMPPTWGDGEDQ